MKKTLNSTFRILAQSVLFFILVFNFSCHEDDLISKQSEQSVLQDKPRIQLKKGNQVSEKITNFIKQKTNSSYTVNMHNNKIVLAKDKLTDRNNTAFGIVKTDQQISVVNQNNTKHTFLISPNTYNPKMIINLVINEDSNGNLNEYFIKYINNSNFQFDSAGDINLGLFNGIIETYSASGVLIGTTTINSGSTTNVSGYTSSGCEDDNDDDNDNDNNNNNGSGDSSGGGGGYNNDDNDNSGNGNTGTGSGSSFVDVGSDEETDPCGFSYHYVCNGGRLGPHKPRDNDNFPSGKCSGAGAGQGGMLVVTDCNGGVVSSSRSENSTNSSNLQENPCGGDVGLLIDIDQDDQTPCENALEQIQDEDFQAKLQILNENTSSTQEMGFSQNANDNEFSPIPINSNNSHSLNFAPSPTLNVVGYMHNHLDDFIKHINGENVPYYPIRIFSPRDIRNTLTIAFYSSTPYTNYQSLDAYGVMASSDGNYMLKFDGDLDDIQSNTSLMTLNDLEMEELNEVFKKEVFDINVENREKKFLSFIKNKINIPGIKLLRLNDDGSIDEISLDENNNRIITTC